MTPSRTPQPAWPVQGTVYGTLLNFRREWDLWSARMTLDPYKAAPKAPVLYLKTANTWCPAGQDLVLQDGVTEVDVGATLGLVMGDHGQVAGAMLLNDWSVPHESYYRPPVKSRCRDGFLALPQQFTPGQVQDWATLHIEVRRGDTCVQTVQLSDLVRGMPALLADVGEFMTLQPGDVLMVGTDCLTDGTRPRAKAGDRVEISAPGFAPVITHVKGQA